MIRPLTLPLSIALALLASSAAHASFVISNKATHNVSCTRHVCTPTAPNANLNVSELTNMLAAGNMTLKSGNSDGAAASIVIADGFSWTSTSRLTLDAKNSITVKAPVVVAGTGGLTLTYSEGGGDLHFLKKGKIDFWDLHSNLIVNDKACELVGDLKGLVTRMSEYPDGLYALARDYDASIDGPYTDSPIAEVGIHAFIEGLGHTIAGLTIDAPGKDYGLIGLFATNEGTIRDLRAVDVRISVQNAGLGVGAVVGQNLYGTIVNTFASGSIDISGGGSSDVGGLVGDNRNSVRGSEASVRVVSSYHGTTIGGLTGYNDGSILNSLSSGHVVSVGGDVGGLVGYSQGSISASRATGKVVLTADGAAGGLVGRNDGTVTGSFARVSVQAKDGSAGGLVGVNTNSIKNSSASGPVRGDASIMGGFVGANSNGWDKFGTIDSSYATGDVTVIVSGAKRRIASDTSETPALYCQHAAGGLSGGGGTVLNSYALGNIAGVRGDCLGGLVGGGGYSKYSYAVGTVSSDEDTEVRIGGYIGSTGHKHVFVDAGYWDIDSSGLDVGCGFGICTGVTGLTDAQLKSGLPEGFDPAIWGSNPNINNGYPYLLANPPPK